MKFYSLIVCLLITSTAFAKADKTNTQNLNIIHPIKSFDRTFINKWESGAKCTRAGGISVPTQMCWGAAPGGMSGAVCCQTRHD